MATREPTTENAIQPTKREPAAGRVPKGPESEAVVGRRRAARPAVPEHVQRRFVQVGRKYFFPDGAPAFTDRGQRLLTPSENTEVIRSLVQIAASRGWDRITVTGTERFRREAWFEARMAGLQVRGFGASEIEEERLVRALARRGPDAETPMVRGEQAPRRDELAAPAVPAVAERKIRDRLLVGRLMDHGKAAFHHDARAAISYFVRLETGRGERTIWGVDLERAIKESLTKPQLGEEVGLRVVSQDPVTVETPAPADAGSELTERALRTHRNRWIIEKRGFFEERAAAAALVRDPKVDPREAVRKHPELTSTYLHLQGAEEVAAKRIRDPQDQRKFVSLVRSALADSVARGEPLQPVRLRARGVVKSDDRAKSRENDRAR